MALDLPAGIRRSLLVPTPETWLDAAVARIPDLLLDHANCELKAASTALGFIYRYPERTSLTQRMSKLAREELRHFEQVRKILDDADIAFRRTTASRYAGRLRDAVREDEPYRLLDMLLIGALIEARSCERFAALVPRLEGELARFYAGLLASEARHFDNYLAFARSECERPSAEVDDRLEALKRLEAELIEAPDPQFRFHSGVPA